MLIAPYTPYTSTKWEKRIDNAIGLLLPERMQRRVVAREQTHFFRYLAAQSNPSRRNSQAGDAGETIKKSREKLQILWNAIETFENSGLCGHLIRKMSNYIVGTLRYQARTGDNTINNEYEDYMRLKCTRQIDFTKRFSLRKMCMLAVRGIGIKGDMGINIVRDGADLFLQGIEADRIGDPNQWENSNNYVRGMVLNDMAQIYAVRVFNRDRRNGRYTLDGQYPMWDEHGLPKFLFLVNPISFDDYRGVSILSAVMDLPTYCDRMRNYELQAMLWASSRSGVYYTKNAMLPKQLPFDANPAIDNSGNILDTFQVRPNIVTALSADGEKVEMFHNERPSPNVIAMYKDTKAEVINGFGFTTNFIDPTGTGPAVRQCSAQDARAIEEWQGLLREDMLDWVHLLILGNAIANGELPYHPRWHMGQWFFPPKTSIDVGRDSKANIEELEAGINDGASIAAENSQDIDEIKRQRATETEQDIELAQEIAKKRGIDDWKIVYSVMFPRAAKNMLPPPKVDARGATSDGADMGDDGGAKQKQRHTLTIEHKFYREDQSRDDSGRFADEGGSSNSFSRPSPPVDEADIPRYIHEVRSTPIHKEVESRLNKLAAASPNGDVTHWSIGQHTDASGNYTPERQALHEQIISRALNPDAIATGNPKLVAIMGPPGSGKTSAAAPIASGMGKFTYVNSDDIKAALPEYEGWNAPAVHEESTQIMGMVQERAMAANHNIMLDMTGKDTGKTTATLDALAKHGYESHVIAVTVPDHVSTQRAWERFAKDANGKGRFVELGFVKQVDGNPEKTYQALKSKPYVKSWRKLNNNVAKGQPPEVTEEGSR